MKKIVPMVAVVSLFVLAFAAHAATTWTSTTWSPLNSKILNTAVATTEKETGPTSAADGVPIRKSGDVTLVVTAKAHLLINVSTDVGYYDPTDASALESANTFLSSGHLRCYVYDSNTALWTRFTAGDIDVVGGSTQFSALIPVALPPVDRVAYVPYATNVPAKVYISER